MLTQSLRRAARLIWRNVTARKDNLSTCEGPRLRCADCHGIHELDRARSVIFAANLVVIAIDRPFSGAVVVSQQPIRAVLDDLENLP